MNSAKISRFIKRILKFILIGAIISLAVALGAIIYSVVEGKEVLYSIYQFQLVVGIAMLLIACFSVAGFRTSKIERKLQGIEEEITPKENSVIVLINLGSIALTILVISFVFEAVAMGRF